MLILAGVKEDVFWVGDVKIKICEIQGRKVRLGFEAPRDIPIYRDKVYQRIKKEELKK